MRQIEKVGFSWVKDHTAVHPPLTTNPLTRPHRETGLHLGIKDRSISWSITRALYLFSLLPDFLLYPIGIAGGFIGYRLDRRHHVIGLRNLAIAFPERSEASGGEFCGRRT